MDPPVQIGQYVLGKNLGIGAFGKVSYEKAALLTRPQNPWCQAAVAVGWDCDKAILFAQTYSLSPGDIIASCGGKENILLLYLRSSAEKSVRILQQPSPAAMTPAASPLYISVPNYSSLT
eukprot:scaffold1823_cov111-Skeletonema_marinoi.AAC.2